MTREETIAYGKEQLEVFGGKHAEFIKIAIEALKQEPDIDKILARIDFEEKWLWEAGYNASNVKTAFWSIKHDLRKLSKISTGSENKVGWSSLENVRNKVEKENEE